jgi:acetyl-CoA decarbonylase/synthase complex subunit gamma
MALTAIEIFKNLPKTNCRDCGFPTCLAFAMQLAAKKVELAKCPHVSEEGKAALEGASAPPIKLVTIGTGDAGGHKAPPLRVGNETVLFRHEQTFHHPAGVAVVVSDTEDLGAALAQANALEFERVGTKISIDLVALRNDSGDPARFRAAAEQAASPPCEGGAGGGSRFPLILMSEDPAALAAAAEVAQAGKPLLYAATADNYEKVAALAKTSGCPLAVRGNSVEEVAELTPKLNALGVTDLILDTGARTLSATLADQTKIRRLALRKTFRAVGYPTITFASEVPKVSKVPKVPEDTQTPRHPDTSSPYQESARAAAYVAKYAGIVVLEGREPWQVLPVLTARYNIYTDPQKPIQVTPGVYEIGEVNAQSPVLITTNFSLTYYTVAGDVEASRVPAYIGVIDTEGTSVLTAYASEKLTAEKVTALLNADGGLKDQVSHRKVVIPGLIAVMTAKLKDLSGWDVLVGPRESAGIPKLLRAFSIPFATGP